jgi:glycosyltransferase involved in cell wall biosynthesis
LTIDNYQLQIDQPSGLPMVAPGFTDQERQGREMSAPGEDMTQFASRRSRHAALVSAKAPVSALVPMLNEEANISECLKSLQFCDEVWVVDSGSRDRSPEMARALGARVVQFDYVKGGPKKKNWALANLPFKHPWVLILDCDERVPPELADEIRSVLVADGLTIRPTGTLGSDGLEIRPTGSGKGGYYLNRRVFFLGRWLKHCWYPSWNLRLFQHRLGRYEMLESGRLETGDNEVHEHVLLEGEAGYLKHDLLHYDYRSLHHFCERHNRYSTWEAEHRLRELANEGRGTGGEGRGMTPKFWGSPLERRRWLKRLFLRVPGKPLWRFLYTYFLRRGFLDGYPGFLISAYMAVYEFEIGMKMYELRNQGRF